MMSSYLAKNIVIIDTLLNKLRENQTLTWAEYKVILEKAYLLLTMDDDDLYNKGLSIICHVADSSPQDTFINQLLYDCINVSRVFLYSDMYMNLNKKYENDIMNGNIYDSDFNSLAQSFYTLKTQTVLTRDQKRLFEDFRKYRRLIVSAPTSFGKSKIVSEIIASNNYNNIAIILPTIALLSETYHTLKNNAYLSKYTLINSLNQPLSTERNILIFTPEKMDLFMDSYPTFKIDFFTMDEIYKIQDDDRSQIFTLCLYRLSKMNCDFYLIGPYFKNFSKKFIVKTGAEFRRYTAEIVQKETVELNGIENGKIYHMPNGNFKKLKDEDRNLVNIINIIKGQSLVYLGKKYSVETRAKKIANGINRNKISSDLINYIKETIDKDWSMVKCLEKGVAFHHSGVPKYIQTEIVDAFNDGDIDIIVCSPTLTEGVNTSAKNVIIYDDFKAKEENKLSGFDIKNIKGRAGRFSKHFVGRVITFDKLNESEMDIIQFTFYDRDLEPEEAIQVDNEELEGSNLYLKKNVEAELIKNKIPFDLIKSNKFIPIHKQLLFINFLRKNTYVLNQLRFQSSFPEKEQLGNIIQYTYDYLFLDKDKGNKAFADWQIINYTKYYIYKRPSIKQLIQVQESKNIDTKVRNAFKLLTHYFEFALPKYLTAFQNIFNFVYKERYGVNNAINLLYVITLLEFGFEHKHEIALKEAGLPINIINKISDKFSDCQDLDQIRYKFSINPLLINSLNLFEKRIFKKYI